MNDRCKHCTSKGYCSKTCKELVTSNAEDCSQVDVNAILADEDKYWSEHLQKYEGGLYK